MGRTPLPAQLREYSRHTAVPAGSCFCEASGCLQHFSTFLLPHSSAAWKGRADRSKVIHSPWHGPGLKGSGRQEHQPVIFAAPQEYLECFPLPLCCPRSRNTHSLFTAAGRTGGKSGRDRLKSKAMLSRTCHLERLLLSLRHSYSHLLSPKALSKPRARTFPANISREAVPLGTLSPALPCDGGFTCNLDGSKSPG